MPRILAAAHVTALALAFPLRAQAPPPRAAVDPVARYQELLKRKAFWYHFEARTVLGNTRTSQAFDLLVKDYAAVKEHAEYSRYTIAEVFASQFSKAEAVAPLQALRAAHRGPGDVWLWRCSLEIEANRGGEEAVQKVAIEEPNPLLRAAAIVAIGEASRSDLRRAILPNCDQFPKKEADRMAILGAMSGALLAQKDRVNEEGYRAALTAYIGLLQPDVKLSHTAKVQMARHLQLILGAPALFVNAEAWLEILARGEMKAKTQGATRAAPTFFGVETDGERLCYVVDMSDSMLKPIEPSAKPSGPITGPRPKKRKGAILDESDLPWELIKTRWDLARANLRISLSRLTPDKEFCVVWFGSKAGTLNSCKGMIKASQANIEKVVAELDGITARTEPKDPDEQMPPEGKLRGDTNMHGGLRLAFALHSKGFADVHAYVQPQALAEGCDTILLLSDGDPSVDDFLVLDKNYGEGAVIRSFERQEPAPDAPELWSPGPYIFMGVPECPPLVADVRRMNTFRRIRIHCVGLGEANTSLLGALANVGQGQSLSVGKRQ